MQAVAAVELIRGHSNLQAVKAVAVMVEIHPLKQRQELQTPAVAVVDQVKLEQAVEADQESSSLDI
jgi:hypothetical protein